MTLHFDCFAGISGDMALGALMGLGVAPETLRGELGKLNLSGWALEAAEDSRCGISGLRVLVQETAGAAPSRHAHTHWSEIRALIEASGLSAAVKKRAVAIFSRIAEAEAEVHQTSAADVAFHEVGAVDSIIDIVGTAICIELLKPDRITASEVELGGGTVECAHGILPVPAPATLLLCKNMPVRSGGFDKEMTTPTGAGILAACVDEFVTAAHWREIKTAYGLGAREFDKPNVLRVSLRDEAVHSGGTEDYEREERYLLETAVDDMNGEELGFLMERLFDAGALDVTFTPCVMKKSRPATLVSVLCSAERLAFLRPALFTYSTTLGLREMPVTRYALRRTETIAQTPSGAVRVKTVRRPGAGGTSKIEYEDRARFAREQGLSLREAELRLAGQTRRS